MWLNLPPMRTWVPFIARVCTVKLAFGFHEVTAPEAMVETAATRLRAAPFTWVKRPPM